MIKTPEYDKIIKQLKRNNCLKVFVKYLENSVMRYDQKTNKLCFSSYGHNVLPAIFEINLNNNCLENLKIFDSHIYWWMPDVGQRVIEKFENKELTEYSSNLISSILDNVICKTLFKEDENSHVITELCSRNTQFFQLLGSVGADSLQFYRTVNDAFKYELNLNAYPYFDIYDYHCIIKNTCTKWLNNKYDYIDININTEKITGLPECDISRNNRWGEERTDAGFLNTIIASKRLTDQYKYQYNKQQKRRKLVKQLIMWSLCTKN